MKFYDFGRVVCNALLSIYFKIDVRGIENFPGADKGLILISNHKSYLDPVMLGLRLKGRYLTFMAKEELFHVPILAPIIKKLGAFPVKRGKDSKKAIETAEKTVNDKKLLSLFPEGHRSKDGRLLNPKSGVILIAAQTKADIIPTALYYSGKYPRAKVKVYYGRPIYADELKLSKTPSSKEIKDATKKVWGRVEELYNIETKKGL